MTDMDEPINNSISTSRAPALDPETLDQLLNMGGEELRAALCTQLIEDFRRLRLAVEDDDGNAVARAAHEVKGLAATVGASRLSEMARSLDSVAGNLSAPARSVMVSALQGQIDGVLDALTDAAKAS